MLRDVLVISKDQATTDLIRRSVSEKVAVHAAADLSAAKKGTQSQFDLIFFDVTLVPDDASKMINETIDHFSPANALARFVVLTPKEMIRQAVDCVRLGANDYLTHPIDREEIRLVLETGRENAIANLELEYLRGEFWKSEWLDIVKTQNVEMRKVYHDLRSVAPTIATILLLGETGTGKGLMARLIHMHSHRSEGPFIGVHCGAIAETLIESELFGHEKGAFTGAHRRKLGKFEMAHNGTIFLDEIGTVSSAAQIKLLQVLQDGTFCRVGGEKTLQSNARIIAATNADLNEMAETGRFRKDLLYRLNIFPINLPPLINRLEDLPHLVDQFLSHLNKK